MPTTGSVVYELQQQVAKAAKQMAKDGLASGSFGNVSAANREHNLLAITPSGVVYDEMEAEDICIVQLDGTVVEGYTNRYRPSSELPMHCAIYEARADVNAIVHTHSPYCTAYASAGKPLGPVIAELARDTAKALTQANGCLLANYGAVAVADVMSRAYMLAQILEDGAKAATLAGQIGAVEYIPPQDCAALYEKMKGYGR